MGGWGRPSPRIITQTAHNPEHSTHLVARLAPRVAGPGAGRLRGLLEQHALGVEVLLPQLLGVPLPRVARGGHQHHVLDLHGDGLGREPRPGDEDAEGADVAG